MVPGKMSLSPWAIISMGCRGRLESKGGSRLSFSVDDLVLVELVPSADRLIRTIEPSQAAPKRTPFKELLKLEAVYSVNPSGVTSKVRRALSCVPASR